MPSTASSSTLIGSMNFSEMLVVTDGEGFRGGLDRERVGFRNPLRRQGTGTQNRGDRNSEKPTDDMPTIPSYDEYSTIFRTPSPSTFMLCPPPAWISGVEKVQNDASGYRRGFGQHDFDRIAEAELPPRALRPRRHWRFSS